MKTLKRKGYNIEILHWVGNFGNNLVQLSAAINIAVKTQSKLVYPEHQLLINKCFDFTDPTNTNCGQSISGTFFYQDECFQYPLKYDIDRRVVFRKYVSPLLKENDSNRLVSPVNGLINEVAENTLVVNIRSGDVFRDDWDSAEAKRVGISGYMQPPLSFYKYIILKFGYDDILIVTQPDQKNPCIEGLLAWRNNIRIKRHVSAIDDFNTLLKAKHLITCHSSFSWCAALMSDNLEVLHQPSSFVIKGVKDFSIYTYDILNYIKRGEWENTADNLRLMINHPIEDICYKFAPRTDTWTYDDLELSALASKRWVPIYKPPLKERINQFIQATWLGIRLTVRPRTRLRALFNNSNHLKK